MNAPSQIDSTSVALLLPMSLHVGSGGELLSAGPTVRRLIGAATRFDEAFGIDRPRNVVNGFMGLRMAIRRGDRLFLRLQHEPTTVLRGHGVMLGDGGALLNLGFGVGLSDAVRNFNLSDADFAPSDLAMELLFLHEANMAVQRELASFNRVMDEARRAAQLQAYTDPLTGLCNRRGLEEALSQALTNLDRTPFVVGHLDLDYFKTVNDLLGHAAGDDVLKSVAHILRDELRASDTTARVGGDEFILLLNGQTDTASLQQIGRRIITKIENCLPKSACPATLSASIGFAVAYRNCGMNGDQLCAAADAALYQAKNSGRGRVVIQDFVSNRCPGNAGGLSG